MCVWKNSIFPHIFITVNLQLFPNPKGKHEMDFYILLETIAKLKKHTRRQIMVGSIGNTSNFISMISSSYQQSQTGSTASQGVSAPPPPPGNSGGHSVDPLGVFSTVDSDSDYSISEKEYNTLTEGILEVTGSQLTSNFVDFDTDGDGQLSGSELKSVLDEAGFTPPPPPQQVVLAYEAQSGEDSTYQVEGKDMMTQLLEYLETQSSNFDITA